MRRWLVQAAALMLVLPVLVGLLPEPALSAASALERDLAVSVCGHNLTPQQGHSPHQSDHDSCMLCASHCPLCAPSLAAATPAFTAAPQRAEIPKTATAAAVAPPLQALLAARPPRGPPARV